MLKADLDAWQAALPLDRDVLVQLLAQLQANWIRAHAEWIPAQRVGGGAEVQQRILTLGQQINMVERRLID